MFKLLGVAVALYVLYALSSGEIYGKRGIWGRTYLRANDPLGYWGTLGAYVTLSLAAIFVF